jgi:hypothetical protein
MLEENNIWSGTQLSVLCSKHIVTEALKELNGDLIDILVDEEAHPVLRRRQVHFLGLDQRRRILHASLDVLNGNVRIVFLDDLFEGNSLLY